MPVISALKHIVGGGRKNNVPATPSSYEDLSTYTEVDESGFLTVDGTKVTAASLTREALTYLKKDFGEGYFGNFEIHFVVRIDSSDNDNQAHMGCVIVSNSDTGGMREIENGSASYVGLEAGDTFALNVGDMAVALSHDDLEFDTIYYVKFVRSGANNTLYVYTDEAMTVLVSTIPRTDGNAELSYRYMYVGSSYHYGGAFTGAELSGYVDKIKIISH